MCVNALPPLSRPPVPPFAPTTTPTHPLPSPPALSSQGHPQIKKWLQDALSKVAEARDPHSQLSSRGALLDDTAITSMSRLWDIGRSEPIKIGKASPTEGALPSSLVSLHVCVRARAVMCVVCGGVQAVCAVRGVIGGAAFLDRLSCP
jgi:hypothetical protein